VLGNTMIRSAATFDGRYWAQTARSLQKPSTELSTDLSAPQRTQPYLTGRSRAGSDLTGPRSANLQNRGQGADDPYQVYAPMDRREQLGEALELTRAAYDQARTS